MPNLTGVSAMPRLMIGLVAIPRGDRRAPLAVVGARFERVDQLGRDVVLDRHAVRRDVAFASCRRGCALRTSSGSQPQRARDVVDDRLDREHALRSAEAAKRRVGHRVRLAAVRMDRDVRAASSVVDVEHGAIVDRPREVGRETAARRERDVEAEDAARRRRSRRRTRTGTHAACRSSACRRRGRAAA